MKGRRLLSRTFGKSMACPAPSRERCRGWDVETRSTSAGPVRSGLYLCAECKPGFYSTPWNRSCIPCDSSDGGDDSQRSDERELIIAIVCVISYISFLALCVFLVAFYVGNNRKQGLYRASASSRFPCRAFKWWPSCPSKQLDMKTRQF